MSLIELLLKLEKGIKPGIIAGILWGIIVWIIVMPRTHLFEEVPMIQNFFAFLAGGLLMGLLISLIFSISFTHLPASSTASKAVILSLAVWLFFISSGALIAYFEILPNREINLFEILQGFFLFLIFGKLLGFFWSKFETEQPAALK